MVAITTSAAALVAWKVASGQDQGTTVTEEREGILFEDSSHGVRLVFETAGEPHLIRIASIAPSGKTVLRLIPEEAMPIEELPEGGMYRLTQKLNLIFPNETIYGSQVSPQAIREVIRSVYQGAWAE